MTERTKKLARCFSEAKTRHLRRIGALANHLLTHDGIYEIECTSCNHLTGLREDSDFLLTNLLLELQQKKLDKLIGQKILLVDAYTSANSFLPGSVQRKGISVSVTDSVPHELYNYLTHNNFCGAIIHLSSRLNMFGDVAEIVSAQNKGASIVVLINSAIEDPHVKFDYQALLDKHKIRYVEKGGPAYVQESLLVLAGAIT